MEPIHTVNSLPFSPIYTDKSLTSDRQAQTIPILINNERLRTHVTPIFKNTLNPNPSSSHQSGGAGKLVPNLSSSVSHCHYKEYIINKAKNDMFSPQILIALHACRRLLEMKLNDTHTTELILQRLKSIQEEIEQELRFSQSQDLIDQLALVIDLQLQIQPNSIALELRLLTLICIQDNSSSSKSIYGKILTAIFRKKQQADRREYQFFLDRAYCLLNSIRDNLNNISLKNKLFIIVGYLTMTTSYHLCDDEPITFQRYCQLISQLWYLTDNCTEDLNQFNIENFIYIFKDEKLFDTIADFIEGLFKAACGVLHHEIAEAQNCYKKYGLLDPKKTSETKLYRTFARCLITRSGHVNLFLISPIKDALLKSKQFRSPQEQRIAKALNEWECNPDLINLLEKFSLKAPQAISKISETIIRATLGLDNHIQINESHLKAAAFASTLAYLRQESIPNCFTTSFVIQLLENHLDFCLKEFLTFLSKGHIELTLGDSAQRIHTLLKLPSHVMRIKLKINVHSLKAWYSQEKSHPQSPIYIYQHPAILRVCSELGIQNPQEAIRSCMFKETSQFPASKRKINCIEITLGRLLDGLAVQAEIQRSAKDRARFSFLAEQEPCLVRLWEYSLASITLLSPLKWAIIRFIYMCNQDLFNMHKDLYLEAAKQLAESINYNKLHYVYDSTKSRRKLDSNDGVFLLFHQQYSKPYTSISSDKEFTDALLYSLRNALEAIGHKPESKIVRYATQLYDGVCKSGLVARQFNKQFGECLGWVHLKRRPDMKNILNTVQVPNQKELLRYHTPYYLGIGSFSINVSSLILDPAVTLHNIKAESPREVLTQIICYIRSFWTPVETRNPDMRLIASANCHEFNLIPGHPSFYPGFDPVISPEDWIIEKEREGIALWKQVSPTEKHRIVTFFVELFHPIVQLESILQGIQEFLENPYLSMKNFCDLVLSHIQHSCNVQINSTGIRKIEQFILNEALDADHKQFFKHSLIHIADLNYTGSKANQLIVRDNAHLCLLVHPLTEDLVFAAASSSGLGEIALKDNSDYLHFQIVTPSHSLLLKQQALQQRISRQFYKLNKHILCLRHKYLPSSLSIIQLHKMIKPLHDFILTSPSKKLSKTRLDSYIHLMQVNHQVDSQLKQILYRISPQTEDLEGKFFEITKVFQMIFYKELKPSLFAEVSKGISLEEKI